MSNTKLPSPIPAGSVVFVPTGKTRIPKEGDWIRAQDKHATMIKVSCDWEPIDGVRQIYTRHDITTPLHHITPEMVDTIEKLLTCSACCYQCLHAVRAAFAPILEAQEEKVKALKQSQMRSMP